MPEQRRIGYRWNLRTLMAQRNLWNTTELMPVLRSRGINLSESQIYRLVTATPERIPARTLAALCDILDCTPNDLFEHRLRCVPRRQQRRHNVAKNLESNRETRSPRASASSHPRTVSRPRKAEDPIRWPVRCNRCSQHHQPNAPRRGAPSGTKFPLTVALHADRV